MMLGRRQNRLVGWMLTALGLYLLASVSVQAERLPIKAFTTAEGLAQNSVKRIVRDSRGFLWFCTDEGLSRFDGYTFTIYTTAHVEADRCRHNRVNKRRGQVPGWDGAGDGRHHSEPDRARARPGQSS